MPANYALYVSSTDRLPAERMKVLADDIQPAVDEKGYEYCWPDLTVRVNQMPSRDIPLHLNGFEGYVRTAIYKGRVPARGNDIIRRIRQTRLVVGFIANPDMDSTGRAEEILARICGGLKPIMFHRDALYEFDGRLLLGPDGSFE